MEWGDEDVNSRIKQYDTKLRKKLRERLESRGEMTTQRFDGLLQNSCEQTVAAVEPKPAQKAARAGTEGQRRAGQGQVGPIKASPGKKAPKGHKKAAAAR